jgi:cytoskeletal protein RodZ
MFAGASSSVENAPPQIPAIVQPDPLPPTPSEILQQIGEKLRQLREQRHLSLEDISARTQIQPRLVRAIEEGHIEMLPEFVYVKGMVKRYGDSLGLDGLAISQQVPKWAPEAATFDPTTRLQTTGFNQPVRVNPLHVYLIYVLAVVSFGAGTSQLLNNVVRHPSIPIIGSEIELAPTVGIARVPAVAPQQILPSSGVRVAIGVKSPTWAQIGIDGTTKFTGNLTVGMKLDWIAKKQVTINTNNAGGLLISRDSQPPQPLGKIGQKQSVTIKVGKY